MESRGLEFRVLGFRTVDMTIEIRQTMVHNRHDHWHRDTAKAHSLVFVLGPCVHWILVGAIFKNDHFYSLLGFMITKM